MNIILQENARQVWEDYGDFLDETLCHGWRDRFDLQDKRFRTFAERGLVKGSLSEKLTSSLPNALEVCPIEAVHQNAAHPQFDRTELGSEVYKDLNVGTTFYNLSAEANWLLLDILEDIQEQIASCLSSPWRVLGTRAWSLSSHSLLTGPNTWHRDGLPLSLYKLMIFPDPLSSDSGTIQVRFDEDNEEVLETDSPTWVLFKPSELWHRGRPPLKVDTKRYTVEITIVSSACFDVRPFFAGNNARHPYFPWYRACYNGE